MGVEQPVFGEVTINKHRLRQISWWAIAADFPLLYTGAVTLESTAVTVATLVVMGVAAAVATLVY